MGNNQPKESNMGDRLRCVKCGMVLPPIYDFKDLDQETIHWQKVHVFKGGEYFRPVGDNELYQCRDCFYKPIRDQENMRREEMRRREERRWIEEEERKMKEQQRAREAEEKRLEELIRRFEEERKMKEQQRAREAKEKERREDLNQRLEEERRMKEQQRAREAKEKKRREELNQRLEEERKMKEQQRAREAKEKKRREELNQRLEEERKMKEQQRAREAKEKKRREELNRRLEESHKQAREQHEEQMSRVVAEEHEFQASSYRSEFQSEYQSDGKSELLKTLSLKCSIPNLSLTQLNEDQLGNILSALDKLLFDEWISAPPSLSTLQHTQVFITELCVLSLEKSDSISLESTSNHVQSLVQSISHSACNVSESFLLTQALFLNLMYVSTGQDSSDTGAVLIAKRWDDMDLSNDDLFLIEFLDTLMSSLKNVVENASVFILKMEIQCLRLLLNILSNVNSKKNHIEVTEMVVNLVQTNQWTPAEAMTLLKALSEKYSEDAPITEVLTLVHEHDVSPEWTDDSGHSLIQVLDFLGPKTFQADFRKAIRKTHDSDLDSALAELKRARNVDDSIIEMIKNITTSALQYRKERSFIKKMEKNTTPTLQHLQTNPNQISFIKGSLKNATLKTGDIANSLHQLCKAVFKTKGWWPTVQQMLRWCVLVLTEKSGELRPFAMEEDSCVTAMFAATQVFMGNKVDLVLSSDLLSHEQTRNWSDFYQHLGISFDTNMNKFGAPQRNVYEADIVYGTMDDFISDYLLYGLEVMETGKAHLSRGFIIEKRSLNSSHTLEFKRLKENEALTFAAEILQSLMGNLHSEDMELRHGFITALINVLHTHLRENTNTGHKIIHILQKLDEKELPSNEAYFLTILEDLLRVFTGDTKSGKNNLSPVGKWCLELLFVSAQQFQALKQQTREVFQLVSNLAAQQLWSPEVALSFLEALSDHHCNEDCISIMKILHLIETYQVNSLWIDERNQSLLQLLNTFETENLIQHLDNSFKNESEKSIDCLFYELRQMNNIDEETLNKSYYVVKAVNDLIKSGEITHYTDFQRAGKLIHSTATEDLQEILAVLSSAVHVCTAEKKWWPRATQMTSWCLLALSNTGKLMEMGTGEGKSCVIAMFAALRALRGEKVDVISSSSVLCQRDAEEWANFYSYFGITVDTNVNKTDDKDRKECYQKDVVYGTVEAFAADHLRQTFEMKDVRPDRDYQCVIIDEVDALLLDQELQLTYLSSPMASMQHLNIILAMIWGHVSQYGILSTGSQTFIQGPPASFFKAIFDSIDTDETEINDPMDILHIAEVSEIVPEGFTENIYKKGNDEILQELKTVSQDAVIRFFQEMEHYVPYGFTVYTLDDNGLLCLRKASTYNVPDVLELTFLVLEEGLCCPLYDSEDIIINPIAELISKQIQYTPCTNSADKISVPGFLSNLIEKKISVWVRNAFLAMRLRQGRDYVVENDSVNPVDFRSTGIVELSKKWGDGLQQFVEMKHQVKLSTISTVTNYVSNMSFFLNYKGNIFGTTGTLGTDTDTEFLENFYEDLSTLKMPTFNRKKIFEVKGSVKTSVEEWKSEIIDVVKAQIYPNSYRGGRASLVICETINTAKEIYEELKNIIPGEIILYCRSDKDSLSKISRKLLPGDVIVATNLAGRGTDIKVSTEVNSNGGLHVILSFLSQNTRVELQAFGRTARKGKPGSAQVIMCTSHLQEAFRTFSSLEEAKRTRDRIADDKINDVMQEVNEMKLREDLFSEYCDTLQEIYRDTDGDEERAVVAIMNEFWGIWLQTKSEEIEQLRRNELQTSLKADLVLARNECQIQTSPCSSIYHYIKFGNIALDEKQWDNSARLFEKAMGQDENWAAIAFYNHAYCTIKQRKGDYLNKAKEDLIKAQESLKVFKEECMVCLHLVKMASACLASSNPTSLEKQLQNKCTILNYFSNNISEAINKLDEIRERGRDAVVKKSPMVSLVSTSDEDAQLEAYNLYCRGLKYVFCVEEEPYFPWGALAVFCLGILQIVGGALLTAFTFGAFAQVGMGLIIEGISDCIDGIYGMVTGEFSWKSWAVQKAISIGVSLIGFGVGKLISKGFKASKMLIKGFGKQLKSMPKFLSRQAKEGFSLVAKTNLKNTVKYTAKAMVKEIAMYALGEAEEAILRDILKSIENEVKKGIFDDVKSNLEKDPLVALIDSIILLHLEDKQNLADLLQDHNRKRKLLDVFRELSSTSLQPFYADLTWQNKLNSTISKVIGSVKSETKGKARAILTAIQTTHMLSLASDAIATAHSLSSKFFSNLNGELNKFKNQESFQEKVKSKELTVSENEILKEFKQVLYDSVGALLAQALVEVFHQKFSSHFVSYVQGQVNGIIGRRVATSLYIDRTEEKLRAGQNNRYIAHLPEDQNAKKTFSGESGNHSLSHAERIRNPTTAGTILDIRVLSETTGIKVVILTENSYGKLTKMQELNPGTKAAGQTVTLIYRPKSYQYPDGHYDVHIDNQTVSVVSKGKSCLFHALARGMKPEATEEEIALEANRLQSLEADTLLRYPGQWEPFVKRKEWTEAIRGGDWYMAEGALKKAGKKVKESKKVLQGEIGKQFKYKDWKKYADNKSGVGEFINADHQPPVSSILKARNLNKDSTLAKAMLEVGTNSSPLNTNLIPHVKQTHGHELLTVLVPREIHREFPSTKSQAFRNTLSAAISKDDVVGTFKLTVLGAMPRFRLSDNTSFKNFQNTTQSKTRLKVFENSFQQHSQNMVQEWFSQLQGKGVMSQKDFDSLTEWINEMGYKNQDDPHRKQVANLL